MDCITPLIFFIQYYLVPSILSTSVSTYIISAKCSLYMLINKATPKDSEREYTHQTLLGKGRFTFIVYKHEGHQVGKKNFLKKNEGLIGVTGLNE